MSGSFRAGEEKERPGVYRRHTNAGGSDVAGAAENVGLAVVSGTWGPLNKPVITEGSDDVVSIIGGGKGANVITQMRIGGANTIVVVRVGSGGTQASITLKDDKDEDVVTLTTLYPTSRAFTVTIKESLEDDTQKMAIIQEGTKDLETVTFAAGSAEVAGIIAAFTNSAYVKAVKKADGSGKLKTISQSKFTGGTDPTVTTEAYDAGFEASEEETWDGVAVDSEDRQYICFCILSSTESLRKECIRMPALASLRVLQSTQESSTPQLLTITKCTMYLIAGLAQTELCMRDT